MRHRHDEQGFTLIELLVVMIVIGILAAIAIPVFLTQRGKAHDTSTKADVATLGKEIATYYVDGAGPVNLDFVTTPGSVIVGDAAGYTSTVRLTNGTAVPTFGAATALNDRSAWCVALTDADGASKTFRFSAAAGLELGTC